jgi:hypothetical protein
LQVVAQVAVVVAYAVVVVLVVILLQHFQYLPELVTQ